MKKVLWFLILVAAVSLTLILMKAVLFPLLDLIIKIVGIVALVGVIAISFVVVKTYLDRQK